MKSSLWQVVAVPFVFFAATYAAVVLFGYAIAHADTVHDTKVKADLLAIAAGLEKQYSQNWTYEIPGTGFGGRGRGWVAIGAGTTTDAFYTTSILSNLISRGFVSSSIVDDTMFTPLHEPSPRNYILYICDWGQRYALAGTLEVATPDDVAKVATACHSGRLQSFGKNYVLTNSHVYQNGGRGGRGGTTFVAGDAFAGGSAFLWKQTSDSQYAGSGGGGGGGGSISTGSVGGDGGNGGMYGGGGGSGGLAALSASGRPGGAGADGIIVVTYKPVSATTTKVIFLKGSGSWTTPADWNATSNKIEVIGAGGGGGSPKSGIGAAGAGGGGAYSKIYNLALTGSIQYSAGVAGVAGVTPGTSGKVGGDSWFKGASCGVASLCAKGGGAGIYAGAGGTGGAAASGVGTTKFSGGNGGTNGGTTGGGGGGGGAGGPNGNGANGGTAVGSYSGGAGGGGANGGTAGASNSGTTGGNGGSVSGPQIFLTSGSSWTVPVDWSWYPTSNKIEVIGGGGGGGAGSGDEGTGGGAGGGGAYSKITNLSLTPGANITYSIGTGGAGTSAPNDGVGTAGGDSWFNGATLAGSSVGAKGGSGGSSSICSPGQEIGHGGAGGAAGSGVGTVKNSGGAGGNSQQSGGPFCGGGGGGGGGGAAGSIGSGNAGSNGVATLDPSKPTGVTATGGAGGAGNAGSGGAGGAAGNPAGNGGNGMEFDATHGSGGGGGGTNQLPVGTNAGIGGNYGGGGGGRSDGAGSSGAGMQGLIVISYGPPNITPPTMITLPTCTLATTTPSGGIPKSKVLMGSSTKLVWTSAGATSIVLQSSKTGTISNGVANGSVTVSPTRDTSYRLIVTNAAGSFSCKAAIDENATTDTPLFVEALVEFASIEAQFANSAPTIAKPLNFSAAADWAAAAAAATSTATTTTWSYLLTKIESANQKVAQATALIVVKTPNTPVPNPAFNWAQNAYLCDHQSQYNAINAKRHAATAKAYAAIRAFASSSAEFVQASSSIALATQQANCAIQLWNDHGLTATTTYPYVAFALPNSPGTTVHGTTTLEVMALDDVTVAGVQFKRNGANIGAEDTAVPYLVAWNSLPFVGQTVTLTATVRDNANNKKTATTTVIVQ